MRSITKHSILKAVIFDMDGLVLDTEATYCNAWKKTATLMGHEFSDEFCLSLSGLHYQDVEHRLIDLCGVDFNLKYFFELSGKCWREQVNEQGIAVKKGFLNLLAVLEEKSIPFVLATNSGEANALECLELANLQTVFKIIVTRDHVQQGKPAPDIFLLAAQMLKLSISKCLILEDSATGIESASKTGAKIGYIPSVYPADLKAIDRADYFFNDLDEVIQIIHQLFSHPV
ncbi:MAG: HAD family phosphatase [Methylococcales bacterium]|nr:HAD family phosphatase [Methylococcales bacterium]